MIDACICFLDHDAGSPHIARYKIHDYICYIYIYCLCHKVGLEIFKSRGKFNRNMFEILRGKINRSKTFFQD